jgi:hypothetical protein
LNHSNSDRSYLASQEGTDDLEEDNSFAVDQNIDDGSVIEIEHVNLLDDQYEEQEDIQLATNQNDSPSIPPEPLVVPKGEEDRSPLDHWLQQQQKNTIVSHITPDPFLVSDLGLLQIQQHFSLPIAAVRLVRLWESPTTIPSKKLQWTGSWKTKKACLHKVLFYCLYGLLTNEAVTGKNGENMNLLNPDNPFQSIPREPPQVSLELHHGCWWGETMQECCKGPKEILIPIIGYMDGDSTDNNSCLPVTPLKYHTWHL